MIAGPPSADYRKIAAVIEEKMHHSRAAACEAGEPLTNNGRTETAERPEADQE